MEFSKGITPRRADLREQRPDVYGNQALSFEQRRLYQQAWVETLAHLLCSLIDAEDALEEKRENLQLDADRLFELMDDYNMGYLSTNVFARWVKANCGYSIRDDELSGL